MPVAVPGVTTSFTLAAGVSTQLANSNGGRTYLLITNQDTVNTVWIGFGTNNAATAGMIPIPPSVALTSQPSVPGIVSFLELSPVPSGDVAAYSIGASQISYTER